MEKAPMQEPVKTKITDLFQICYPVVQGGMAWVSGWKLAAAVSNAGGLGLIGSASMSASLLDDHLQKLQSSCDKPFGVNITLAEHHVEDIIDTCIERGVKIVFSSAGSPKKYTPKLKACGESLRILSMQQTFPSYIAWHLPFSLVQSIFV